jgi:menaquinone-dependent protoporphyrinogen oxidase
MRILVSVASKHGSTAEIGEWIAAELRAEGLDVDVAPPPEVTALDQYRAVVLGSAVYAGRWRDEAKDLVGRHGPALAASDVWLFSSGPVGEPLKPEDDPADAAPCWRRPVRVSIACSPARSIARP